MFVLMNKFPTKTFPQGQQGTAPEMLTEIRETMT